MTELVLYCASVLVIGGGAYGYGAYLRRREGEDA